MRMRPNKPDYLKYGALVPMGTHTVVAALLSVGMNLAWLESKAPR